ncbi:hypothetical protein ACEF39_000654 [Stenotrophomonas indicatrix]
MGIGTRIIPLQPAGMLQAAGVLAATPGAETACSAQGKVAAVVVETSSGHALLDEAAAEELRSWHFIRTDTKSTVPELGIARVPMRYELVE